MDLWGRKSLRQLECNMPNDKFILKNGGLLYN